MGEASRLLLDSPLALEATKEARRVTGLAKPMEFVQEGCWERCRGD
jgi:hypothetical protein